MKIAIRRDGRTMSGLPGNSVLQIAYRSPFLQRAFRNNSSGVVSLERTLRILSELFSCDVIFTLRAITESL